MRRSAVGATLALGVLAGLGTHGCGWLDTADDCAQNPILRCGPFALADAGTEGGTDGGDGGTDGGDGGPSHSCIPSENTAAVADTCGVFVSSSKGSDTTGNGTQAQPYKTLTTALTKAKGQPVYVCGEAFNEAVTVSAKVELYGALDCAKGWVYDASTKTRLTAATGKAPLTLTGMPTVAEVLDFSITAADASTTTGESSVAVVVDQATVTFTRCDLVAQGAGGGTAGMSGGMQAAQANGGMAGDAAGVTGTLGGGSGGANAMCSLQGGNGGNGGTIPTGSGQDGQPGDNGNGGPAGVGDTGTGCGGPNPNGTNGGKGSSGTVPSGIGSIDANGYHGLDGDDDATDGKNGTSGGGGGGSMATTTAHGAGGGGGGAGGCGGKHGTPGKAGGGSIALVSMDAKVTLANCTLGAANAGNGGVGGDGQFGQQGGALGMGGNSGGGAGSACAGGKGGDGGNGGNGSGGSGGHSLGIASMGTAPVLDASTTAAITFGTKGSGGKGGNMDQDMNHGADGVAAPCWDFMKNAACAM